VEQKQVQVEHIISALVPWNKKISTNWNNMTIINLDKEKYLKIIQREET
jgi:hypothetical protein